MSLESNIETELILELLEHPYKLKKMLAIKNVSFNSDSAKSRVLPGIVSGSCSLTLESWWLEFHKRNYKDFWNV